MISLGGGRDFNDGTNKYSKLVANTTKIATFVSSVMTFLQKYGFDGLDIDWEHPTAATDKAGYVSLTKALRKAFNPKGYLLSAAVPAIARQVASGRSITKLPVGKAIYCCKHEFPIIVGYDLPALSKTLDFMNLMTYDMHGTWEPTADNIAPLYQRPWDVKMKTTNDVIDYIVNYYISHGFPAAKINLGIPAYGSFGLFRPA